MSAGEATVTSPAQNAGDGLSVAFWGVRGSAPVCGAEYDIFGGSTLCLEIIADGHCLILDAGTGLRQLGQKLQRHAIININLFLTHYHLDHVMGLSMFGPLFQKGTSIAVHAPILRDKHPEMILKRLLGEPYFPVPMKQSGALLAVTGFHPGEIVTADGLKIVTSALLHPGGACGYRFGFQGKSVAVITDHEHESEEPAAPLVAFCAGVDLLLYDSHWDEDVDYASHKGWGHSTWQAGLRLLHAAGARRLGCLHHAPGATDTILLEREARLQRVHSEGFMARQGQTVRL